MATKHALVALLALALALPARGDLSVVGNTTESQSAHVRGARLTPGSTIFSGDTIEVGPHGRVRIALASGSLVRVAENSQVRLAKTAGKFQLTVDRGGAWFRSEANAPVEALLADATIRAANDQPAVGVIHMRSPESAMIGAEKGTLEIRTEHDVRVVTLREGEGVEVTLLPDDSKKKKRITTAGGSWSVGKILLVGAVLGGVGTGISIGLASGEVKFGPPACNEVSPFRCP